MTKRLHKRRLLLPIVALPLLLATGCATRQLDVVEVVERICPIALTSDELNRAADAIDALPAGPDLDYLAGLVERFDDAAVECAR